MSMALDQNIIYGYKTNYERFKAFGFEDLEPHEYDDILANNREDKLGWIVMENDDVFYGKIILSGESSGNDYLLAAESGSIELPEIEKKWKLDKAINAVLPEAHFDNIKVYVLGNWA